MKQKNTSNRQSVGVFSLLLNIISIILLLIVSLFAYVTKLLDPLHVVISLGILYIVYRKVKNIFVNYIPSKNLQKYINTTKKITRVHKIGISVLILLVVIWYVVSSVIPNEKEVFSPLTTEQQTEIVQEDVEVAAVLLDKLILSGEKLLMNPGILKGELSYEEGLSLKRDWESFLVASIETEEMTDRHRYFHQISMFNNKETHTQSFIIAYSLYIKKFEIFHKVISKASENPVAIKIFNEYSDTLGAGFLYDDVTARFFASNSFLRRNLGYLYYQLKVPEDSASISPNYASLLEVSRTSYEYIFKNAFSQITHRSIVYKNLFDRKAFETWLPIQKTVITDKIGNIHVGDRTSKFITIEQIEEMKKLMEPGDIMVYRKNWYASNLGIPGFWTHAGMYTGSLEDMDNFFKEVFPYRGYSSMSMLLQSENPKAYKVLNEKDEKGFIPSVVESQTHGTLIQSVESSASVDYVAVTRTRLTKQEKLEALITAFGHYGQLYDYAFDLDTKNEIYCSELVYDAYFKTSKNSGVTFPKAIISGRTIVTPNGIVEKFVNEFDTPTKETEFVYFLDASETTKQAFSADVKDFITTLSRPKYSTLQE